MKFGVRECADVVLRAKSAQKIGNKIFYKNEPVCYFDTLKTSTFEGAATTVYAQGGRGNARLMSWDGERTVTFTMEDALISPIGLAILTGAGLINADATDNKVIQHLTQIVDIPTTGTNLYVDSKPHEIDGECTIYVMGLNENGEVVTEPYYYKAASTEPTADGKYQIVLESATYGNQAYSGATGGRTLITDKEKALTDCKTALVDFYTAKTSDAMQINITPDKFGGTFYLEASTLWRD